MKIALCYRGHYLREDGSNNNKNSNFFLCHRNHEKYLYRYLENFDLFFHTYSVNDELDSKLVDIVNPTKFMFEQETSETFKRSYTMIKANLLQDLSNYDIVINLRFDLLFLQTWSNFKIEIEKFNFAFKELNWDEIQEVSDLLYVFPPRFIDAFTISQQMTEGVYRGAGLYIYNEMKNRIGTDNLNFMIDGVWSSNTDKSKNGFIDINRNV